MSEYKDFTKDFCFRTLENLKYIEEVVQNDNAVQYEFTQLVNSLLGILVIPQQQLKRQGVKIDDTYIDETILEELRDCILRNDYSAIDALNFSEILRHMRNAIAHGRIEIGSENGIIVTVKFIDQNSKNKEFHIQFTCDNLRKFISDFTDKLLQKL